MSIHIPLRVPAGFKPAPRPARFIVQSGGEQMTRTSHPCGCPSFSKRVRALPALLSETGAQPETCALVCRVQAGCIGCLCLLGHDWSRVPRIARASHCLKCRSLLIELTREIGAPRSSCTTHLRVTNPALRCQSLKGELVEAPAGRSCLRWYHEPPRLEPNLGLAPSVSPLPGACCAISA